MNRAAPVLAAIAVAAALISCNTLSRNNPYDPSAPDYIGITFKFQYSVPVGISPKSMVQYGDRLILGVFKDGTGDCILKMEDNGASQQFGPTGALPGQFAGLTGVCADSAGNVYAVDSQNYFQELNNANIFFNHYPVSSSFGASSIASDGTDLYISDGYGKTVMKYSTGGTLMSGPVSLSVTAGGYFTPGKVFTHGGYVYVINAQKKSEIARMDSNLGSMAVFSAPDEITDAATSGAFIEMLGERAVYRVDSSVNLALKWGDFGEGPGRVLNGKLIAYRAGNETVYILDGDSIKVFGK